MLNWFRNRATLRRRFQALQWEVFLMANEVSDLKSAVASLSTLTSRVAVGVDKLLAQHAGDSAATLAAVADAASSVNSAALTLSTVAEKVDPTPVTPAPAAANDNVPAAV